MQPNVSPDVSARERAERDALVRLMQNASVEITVHDVKHLDACRALLGPATPVYVSFLPKQDWKQTQRAVVAVRRAGFEPIPHLPARQLESRAQLENVLGGFAGEAAVRRILLIAGDRSTPRGPFGCTTDVLQTGLLAAHGIEGVVVAGHPEGHPSIPAPELRASEHAKVEAARQAGLEISFLTQFCFSAAPIIAWVEQLRARGIRTPVVAGLAGPARVTTLLRYAMICGVGPSLRALSTRTDSITQLASARGPEPVIRALARAGLSGAVDLAGIHLFSFGGLMRTCAWIDAAARGQFRLADDTFHVVAGPTHAH